MSLISQIKKPEARPPIITIGGNAGTGKSSLAATFPKPVFLRAEDGVGRISREVETPDAFPAARNADDVFEQLLALLNEDHDYKTLVVDSVTALDVLFTDKIVKESGKNNIAQAYGGHGAGYNALVNMHGRVRKAAGLLNERKGMTVIFIAHADLEDVKLPDVEDYARYTIAMYRKAKTHYVDNVDFVGYVRLKAFLSGDDGERKRVRDTGDRELVCHATAASVSKNGYGITEPLDFEEGANPLAPYLAGGKRKPDPVSESEPDPDEYDGGDDYDGE